MPSTVFDEIEMGCSRNKLHCLQTIVCWPKRRMRHLMRCPPLNRLRIGGFMMMLKVQLRDLFLFFQPQQQSIDD